MIHVNRKEEPEVFRSEKMQEAKIKLWEQQKNKKAQERLIPDSSPYNPAYVRSELSKTFNNKCAYCESSLGEAGKLYIDHFRPRTGSKDFDNKFFPDHYAWLSYDWANLYLSCEVCN